MLEYSEMAGIKINEIKANKTCLSGGLLFREPTRINQQKIKPLSITFYNIDLAKSYKSIRPSESCNSKLSI